MLSKIKMYAAAIGAALLAVFYALFRIEKSKRKRAEFKSKVHESNAKAQERSKQALDYAVSERDRAKAEIQKDLDKAQKVLNEHDNEIIDDSLRDDVVSLLQRRSDKKRTD